MQVETQEETELGAWMENKRTETSDPLELVSLKESIIRKAWVGWEEGLKLSHRQQEIGEVAARMETASNQPILISG